MFCGSFPQKSAKGSSFPGSVNKRCVVSAGVGKSGGEQGVGSAVVREWMVPR